jgi:uncharacterized protein (TIGR02001 family)
MHCSNAAIFGAHNKKEEDQLPQRTIKKQLTLAIALVVSTTLTPPVFAGDTTIPGEFSANVAFTTNYMYRGVTQTSDGPAIQGGFDYSNEAFYIGTWASSLDFGDTSSSGIEIDYYAGYAPTLGHTDLDFGIIYYTYPDSIDDGAEQDFVEIYAAAGGNLTDSITASVKLSYSSDFYGETGEAWYPELNVAYAINERFSVDGHVGSQTFKDDLVDDYTDWNVGLTYSSEWADFDLRYYDTQDRIGGTEDDVIAFAISKSF